MNERQKKEEYAAILKADIDNRQKLK